MSATKVDVAKKAADLEPKLKGKKFFGGDRPSSEDVKAFNDLLGAGNINFFRWIKNMTSFTEAERNAFPAPVKHQAHADPHAAPKATAAPAKAAAPAKEAAKPAEKKPEDKKPAADDDVDIFGEETEEEKAALAEKKKKADETKKEKKAVVAKSSILLDIKPWDDTTDLKKLGELLKGVERDGLLWGAQKLVPVAYGVNKLVQMITIEDDKISSDDLEDIVMSFEDYVQSMDIAAWNKV